MTEDSLHIGEGLRLPAEDFIESKVGIIGQSGRGKSGLLKVIEEELVRLHLPFVVFDPAGIAWGIRSSYDGKGPGLPVLVVGGSHGDVPLNPRAGAEVARAIVEANVSAVIDTSEESKTTYRTFVRDFADAIFSLNKHYSPRLLILDEAPDLVPQNIRGMPDLAQTFYSVERLVRQGRNNGLGVVLVSQRAATISKDVLTQCGSLFVFGLVGTPDRKALKEWVEAKADAKQLSEFESGLASLGVRECWFWSPSEFKRFQKVRVREFRTFHPDRTHLRRTGMLAVRPVTTDISSVVTKLGTAMARIAGEKVELAEIPKLKRRVRELEQQAKDATAETRVVERAVADPRAIERAVAAERESHRIVMNGIARRVRSIAQARDSISAALADLPNVAEARPAGAPRLDLMKELRESVKRPVVPVGATAAAPATTGPALGDGEVQIKAGAKRMLAELASRHPLTLTRSQLATLVGMTASGGTFTTYLSVLKRAGLMAEDTSGQVSVTEQGLDFTGEVPPAPSTHREVMARWRQSLKAGCYRMLETIVGNPTGITKDELAGATGFAATGGTFTTYLSILRRNELAEVVGEVIRPSESLFP